MAVNESATFLQRSQTIIESIDNIRVNCPSNVLYGFCGAKHETKTCDPKTIKNFCVNCD
jgi:hypothetical protein